MFKRLTVIVFSIHLVGMNMCSVTALAKEQATKPMNGIYQISSAADAKYAFDESATLSDTLNKDTQKWKITSHSSGTFTITNVNSNKALDIVDDKLKVSDTNRSASQQWNVKRTSDGYKIESAVKSDFYLSVPDLKTGTRVSLRKANRSGNQSWHLSHISSYSGPVLSTMSGTVAGPSGKETYYNLDMSDIVSAMKKRGIDAEYWVRGDGVKMYGEYVMVAANLDRRPYGTLVKISLGMGMVVDTGGFALSDSAQLDIATNW